MEHFVEFEDVCKYYQTGSVTIDAAQKQLEEGWAEYNAGQTQLEESRTEYESRLPASSCC